jgi:hypothetical protein
VEMMQKNQVGAESTGWFERWAIDRIGQSFAGRVLKRQTNIFNKH